MGNRIGTLIGLAAMAFMLVGCSLMGTSTVQQDQIDAAVAQTVTALNLSYPTIAPTFTAAPIIQTATTIPAATASPTLTLIPTYTPVIATALPCNWPVFISETVPDDTVFSPGTSFQKTWRISNAGNCAWNTSYKLVFTDGYQMGGPDYINFSSNVYPNGVIDLTLNLVAAATDGTYRGVWQLQTDSGYYFGQVWVEIVVSG